MRHFRKIKDVAMVGGISAMVLFVLQGCDNTQNYQNTSSLEQSTKKGAYVLLEEQKDGSYKILEEYPSSSTHIVVRDQNGKERLLSKEEVDELIKKEEKKIDNNTSELTSGGNQGLGLGGAILASAAGAILGSYIGNKLFNNPNYQQNQQRTYKSPQAYERSKNSFKNTTASSAAKTSAGKSGFFKSSGNTGMSNNRSFSG